MKEDRGRLKITREGNEQRTFTPARDAERHERWRRAVRLEDPLEGANCGLCGATADNFHVSDELWERVGLGHVQACFKCFRIAAWHVGVRPETNWEISLGVPDVMVERIIQAAGEAIANANEPGIPATYRWDLEAAISAYRTRKIG